MQAQKSAEGGRHLDARPLITPCTLADEQAQPSGLAEYETVKMSGILPVIVTSNVDVTRPCDRSSSVHRRTTVRPAPSTGNVLGECDEPPLRLPRGRMKYMIHKAVVDGRLATVKSRVNVMTMHADLQHYFQPVAQPRWGTGRQVPTLPRPGWVVRFA